MLVKHKLKLNKGTFEIYVDFAQTDPVDFWTTGWQLGKLLGFKHPARAIEKIRVQHSESLAKYSQVFFKGNDSFTLYNVKGMIKICCYSKQPNYLEVIDLIGGVLEFLKAAEHEATKRVASEAETCDDDNQSAPKPEQENTPNSEVIRAVKEIKHELAHLLHNISELRSEIKALKAENEECHVPCCELWPFSCLVFKR